MSHINSNNISIFPLAKSRSVDRSGRMFYENNIANLVRHLIDSEGFICEPSASIIDKSNDTDDFIIAEEITETGELEFRLNSIYPLKFNIYGYYVSIQPGSILFTSSMPDEKESVVCAYIITDNATGEIVGQDNTESKYEGLTVSVEEPSYNPDTQTLHALPLFRIDEVKRNQIPIQVVTSSITDSFNKFTQNSLALSIDFIDGKR